MSGRAISARTPSTWTPHAGDSTGLLDVTEWKQFEKAGAPSFAITANRFHNMTGIGSGAMFVQPLAHEMDDTPMVFAEHDTFACGQHDRDRLVPVIGIDQVTFGINRDRKLGNAIHSNPFDSSGRAASYDALSLRNTVANIRPLRKVRGRSQAIALLPQALRPTVA